MATWLRRTTGALSAAAVGGGLALGAAARRWQVATERLTDLVLRQAARPHGTVSFETLESLPPPVKRYFRMALRDGQPRIRTARVTQRGEFRSKESSDTEAGWQPFTAIQVFGAGPPAFVWDARIRMAPLVRVWVRDAYVEGRASMLGAVLAAVPVVDESNREELRAGALQRYLAESVWFPTALLPSDSLTWSPVDDTHARAALTDGSTSVSLDFEFGSGSEIVGSYAAARLRSLPGEKGRYEQLAWGGRYRGYEERDGMRVPTESEVYWVVKGREQPYYRGRNLNIAFS